MNKADKFLYQENVAGANLVVLFVLLNVVFTIFNLRVMPVMYEVGIFVLYNIAVSLVGFLASTKMKIYSRNWAYAGLGIAVLQLIRMTRIPDVYEPGFTMTLNLIVILSALALAAGSVITIRRAGLKNTYEASLKAD